VEQPGEMDDGIGSPQMRDEVVTGDVRRHERRLRRLPLGAPASEPDDLRHPVVGRQRADDRGPDIARRPYDYDLHADHLVSVATTARISPYPMRRHASQVHGWWLPLGTADR
jgi:hypothetical protein